jgi:hypothetical protein
VLTKLRIANVVGQPLKVFALPAAGRFVLRVCLLQFVKNAGGEGDRVLACAILSDGTRVLSQGGVATAFGPVTGGYQERLKASDDHAGGLPPFLVAKSLQPFISDELRTLVSTPRKYRDPRGGPIRVGLEATLLPKVCEVWLRARDADKLTAIQKPVAERADILMRGLAHIGIIALVDEATGF